MHLTKPVSLSLYSTDHSKEYKKLRAEIKKKSEVSSRLQKKNKKNKTSESAQKAADASVQDVARQFKVSTRSIQAKLVTVTPSGHAKSVTVTNYHSKQRLFTNKFFIWELSKVFVTVTGVTVTD